MKKHYIIDLDETLINTSKLKPYLQTKEGREYLNNNIEKVPSKDYDIRLAATLDAIIKKNEVTILTNSPESYARKILAKHRFPDLKILGDAKKPNNTSLEYIIKNSDVERKHTLLIGDSSKDILTAHNSKIPSVGVSWGYSSKEQLVESEPRFIFNQTEELLNFLYQFQYMPLDYVPNINSENFDHVKFRPFIELKDYEIENHSVGDYYPWGAGHGKHQHSYNILSFKDCKNFNPIDIKRGVKREYFSYGKVRSERDTLRVVLGDLITAYIGKIDSLNIKGPIEIIAAPNSMPEYCYKLDINNAFSMGVAENYNQVYSIEDRKFIRTKLVEESHTSQKRTTVEEHLRTIGVQETNPQFSLANNIIIFDDVYTLGRQTKSLGIIAREQGFAGNIYAITLGKNVHCKN